MMAGRFRREDVSFVPSGWHVRTVKHGDHRVRVAFPPGRKIKGSGRLISILHPIRENPSCGLKSANPAELMVMSANNPPRKRSVEAKRLREVEKISASLLKLADKAEKKGFKALAAEYRQAARKNPSELVIMAANPRVEVVHGDNPPVEEIAEEFSGVEVKWLDVYNEPHIPRGRYAYLAKLFRLLVKPVKGGPVQKITFEGNSAPLIVSDASGKQIYFVDGNQDITECLAAFGDFGSRSMDGHLKIGDGREIHYIGKKHHIGDEDTDEWRHTHGEENGALPTVLFDTRSKRLLYEGGDYRIEGPWIHN